MAVAVLHGRGIYLFIYLRWVDDGVRVLCWGNISSSFFFSFLMFLLNAFIDSFIGRSFDRQTVHCQLFSFFFSHHIKCRMQVTFGVSEWVVLTMERGRDIDFNPASTPVPSTQHFSLNVDYSDFLLVLNWDNWEGKSPMEFISDPLDNVSHHCHALPSAHLPVY